MAQRIAANGAYSAWVPVATGVPQRCLPFKVFISDPQKECTPVRLADDAMLGGEAVDRLEDRVTLINWRNGLTGTL